MAAVASEPRRALPESTRSMELTSGSAKLKREERRTTSIVD